MGILSAVGKGVQKAIPSSLRVSTSGPLHVKGVSHPGFTMKDAATGGHMTKASMPSMGSTTHTVNVAKAGAMGGAGAAGLGMGNHFAHKNDASKSVY